MGRLNHTPEWYEISAERNGWGEKFHQGTRKMLKEDMNDNGGDFDPRLSDLENLGNYAEFYCSEEFIRNCNQYEIDRVFWDDMKEINPGAHYIHIKGLEYGEEEYHKIVDICAENILSGADNILIKYLKRIKSETQRRINKKDTDKKTDTAIVFGVDDVVEKLKESPYHTWNRGVDIKDDYDKELLNHYRSCLLLKAVQVRMKELYERRCQNVKSKLDGRITRQAELEEAMEYPELSKECRNWWSKGLRVSVAEQDNYLDEITGPNKED